MKRREDMYVHDLILPVERGKEERRRRKKMSGVWRGVTPEPQKKERSKDDGDGSE